MDASVIVKALMDRYKQPEWAIFFEVGNGTGSNCNRHADALAVNMYPSRGLAIMGFEIKVSRTDLRRELLNPDKAEDIARYCNAWHLVVPKGLIKDDDNIPLSWGVMECQDGKLRVTKAPQPLNPVPVTKDFMCAVLRSAGKVDEATIAAARAEVYRKAYEDGKRSMHHEIEALKDSEAKATKTISQLEKALGMSIRHIYDIDNLAEKIKVANAMDKFLGKYSDIQVARTAMQRFLKATDNIETWGK